MAHARSYVSLIEFNLSSQNCFILQALKNYTRWMCLLCFNSLGQELLDCFCITYYRHMEHRHESYCTTYLSLSTSDLEWPWKPPQLLQIFLITWCSYQRMWRY